MPPLKRAAAINPYLILFIFLNLFLIHTYRLYRRPPPLLELPPPERPPPNEPELRLTPLLREGE